MHDYYYDIVCMQNYDIIPLLRFCEVLYINIRIGHAKIFINLPPGNHENSFSKSVKTVYRGNRVVTGSYRLVKRLKLFVLPFWFGFLNLFSF
jgi:hypothetical protein